MYARDLESLTLHSSSKLLQQKFAELLWSIAVAKFYLLQHSQACSHPLSEGSNSHAMHTSHIVLWPPLCYRNTECKKLGTY